MSTITGPDNEWTLTRTGPLIILDSPDVVVTMCVSWRQDGSAACVYTKYTIDGDVVCKRRTGTSKSWPTFWSHFLDLVPLDWQGPVAHSEWTVRY